jgi:hypothetical protein
MLEPCGVKLKECRMETLILYLGMFSTMAAGILGMASFVCYIVVLIQLARTGQTEMLTITLVMTLCFGLGVIIAFILGWGERQLRAMMLFWGALVLVWLVPMLLAIGLSVVAGA